MGEVIRLAKARANRAAREAGREPSMRPVAPAAGPATFYFALDCPLSYVAAERVERVLGEIAWVPVLGASPSTIRSERVRNARSRLARAEHEARALDIPIVEPHRYPFDARPISRAATWAAEQGAGPQFAMAALRLAFCGGYDLASPCVIGEAAASAGLRVGEAVAASGDFVYDLLLESVSRELGLQGVGVPAIRIGTSWFEGVHAVTAAAPRALPAKDGDALPLDAG